MTEEIKIIKDAIKDIKELMKSNGSIVYFNSAGKEIFVELIASREEFGIMVVDMPEGDFDPHEHVDSVEFGMIISGDGYARVEFNGDSPQKIEIGDVFVFPKGKIHKWRSVGKNQRVLFITVPKDVGYP